LFVIERNYGLDGWDSIPGKVRAGIFLFSKVPRPTLWPIHLLIERAELQGLVADHSPLSSVQVKNDGATSPLLDISS
jgi:hypothetical protein